MTATSFSFLRWHNSKVTSNFHSPSASTAPLQATSALTYHTPAKVAKKKLWFRSDGSLPSVMQRSAQGCLRNLWDILASVSKLETDRKLHASSQSHWRLCVCVCVCVCVCWGRGAVSSPSSSLTVNPTLRLPASTSNPPSHQWWTHLCELWMLPLFKRNHNESHSCSDDRPAAAEGKNNDSSHRQAHQAAPN